MTIAVSSLPATRRLLCGIILLSVGVCPAQPQSDKSEKTIHIPSSGGEVLIASPAEKASAYDQYHYSPARRVGDTLYISGVVVGRRNGEGKDIAAFKAQVRRAFQRIQATLNAAGANFDDVVMLNTFHVWQGPNFEGDRACTIRRLQRRERRIYESALPGLDGRGNDRTDPRYRDCRDSSHCPPQ